jgi:Na+-translocating ferredoxin:NAD+ oxidoreductase RnfG subunit
MFTLIAIIAVLLAGVIYQFVVIKKLEKQNEKPTSSIVYILNENNQKKI